MFSDYFGYLYIDNNKSKTIPINILQLFRFHELIDLLSNYLIVLYNDL